MAKTAPLFSVFIPTFNRAHTLMRALDSVAEQTFRDFEILIIDDGSTDGTQDLVQNWRKQHDIDLQYIYQDNQGKHVAYNTAAEHAQGFLLALLDSDDIMLPNALQDLADAWHSIPAGKRERFAGVEGLCQKADGQLHGTSFPEDLIDSNYLEIRRLYGVTGEKRHAVRVDVLRRFPYPVISGEKHIRPDFTWKRISHEYQFRYFNKVLQVVEFQADGLTRNASIRRLRTAAGMYLYWHDDIANHAEFYSTTKLRYATAQFIRYGFLSGHGLRRQWQDAPSKLTWLSMLPRGFGDYLVDAIKRRLLRVRGVL